MPPGRWGEPEKGSADASTSSNGPIDVDYSVDDVTENPIMGSLGQCVDKLEKFEDLGINDIAFDMSFGASHKDVMSSLELMATRVIPHFV